MDTTGTVIPFPGDRATVVSREALRECRITEPTVIEQMQTAAAALHRCCRTTAQKELHDDVLRCIRVAQEFHDLCFAPKTPERAAVETLRKKQLEFLQWFARVSRDFRRPLGLRMALSAFVEQAELSEADMEFLAERLP